ncbi:MAG TPA: type II toxin-antitoxin system PemK/MazF family toxin [Terriglobia bacterium]|nr:type II toxin-antitoxin system PemK/MazF family toxin [Terriglobia bacterium]
MMAHNPPSGWFPRRGEIYLVRLDKNRPALVISTDALNRHAPDVCVVPLTTFVRPKFSLRVHLEPGAGGLSRDSWAKCDQVTTLEKNLLLYPALGRLGDENLKAIEQAIKLALQLT